MKNIDQDCLFLFAETVVRRNDSFELYVKGSPGFFGSTKGSDVWIEDFARKLKNHVDDPYSSLNEMLKKTTGLFLVLIKTKERIIIASDHIRSFPVFYGYHKGKLFITDHIEYYQKENGRLDVDHSRIKEFLATGNVFGSGTLYENVFGIQAAEIVSIHDEDIHSDRYFVFETAKEFNVYDKIEDFAKEFNDLFLFVFSRILEQNPDVNNWIVPLSGGHDSRLVVNFLYRLGVKNVKCFSYGTPGNNQAQISKQVADALGYEWHFVEYTNQKWKKLFDDGLFDEYINFAFNGVSTVHIQDFLALHELKNEGVIGVGDIILPGHTTVTETVFSEEIQNLENQKEAFEYASSKIVIMSDEDQSHESLFDSFNRIYNELKSNPENFLASCDWQERQAKFITNSVRAYEFYGFRCLQPMWDREMVDFWLKIPPRKGEERAPLYRAEELGGLVEELESIPFANSVDRTFKRSFISAIKKIIPYSLIVKLLRVTKRQVVLDEGLNKAFALSAKSVEELLEPIEDFPKETIPYFRDYLDRFPFQLDYNKLTTLYTVRLLLNKSKEDK